MKRSLNTCTQIHFVWKWNFVRIKISCLKFNETINNCNSLLATESICCKMFKTIFDEWVQIQFQITLNTRTFWFTSAKFRISKCSCMSLVDVIIYIVLICTEMWTLINKILAAEQQNKPNCSILTFLWSCFFGKCKGRW